VCPRCRERFSSSERFCLNDANVLVEEIDMARLGTTVGNYHLEEIIGRGGMGTVYSGMHIYIRKRVAVKVLHSQFAQYEEAIHRFLSEARAASSIQHPNIVDVTDFGPMPDAGVYFVMEYLEGTSLEDLIDTKEAIELHRALNITNQIALALAAAHEKLIIHRDLKPENIMLIRKPGRRELVRTVTDGDPGSSGSRLVVEKEDEFDFVKVLDFGIAKVLTPDGGRRAQTAQGAVFGTPEYMSPEAARGEDVDRRSDIYSVGVILFDMLTGRPPFEAEEASDVLKMQISSPPPRPRDVAPQREITPACEALILKALAKNPDLRHQNMDEFRAELQSCYGTVAYARNRPMPNRPTGAMARKRRLTEELDDWLQSDQSKLSLEEARMLAMLGQAETSFSSPTMTRDEEERLASALDAALDDDDF
jgi:serine/threonine-protein kinase